MDVQNNVPNEGSAPEKVESKNVLMAIFAYIGPLVIVSYIIAKDNAFAKFHIKQGFVLFVIELAVWVLGMMMWQLMPLFSIINIATFALSIIGIVNVLKGKQEELPFVGKFSKHFPL
ncbi:MAG: hypothetical protein NUV61_00550 [Candidatus Azambacteria bacterium]|nr:hypothetical protein [Candidatus Azambacteria bacterium]